MSGGASLPPPLTWKESKMIRTIVKQHGEPRFLDGIVVKLRIAYETADAFVLDDVDRKLRLAAKDRQEMLTKLQESANGMGATFKIDFDPPLDFVDPNPAYERRLWNPGIFSA